MRYSDFFELRNFLPVYDITDEQEGHWTSFIPTAQFAELLSKSLTALTSSDVSKRKSMWVRGTFGTGKSHASAVIKHLLCDDLKSISSYLNTLPDAVIREKVRSFRQGKRFFPVVLKGVEGAYDIPRFSLSLQRETKKALAKAGYGDFVVNSDYETAISWIKTHKSFVSEILENNDNLKMLASSPEKIITKLQINDTDTYLSLAEALAEHDIYLSKSETISDWLVEVEKEVEAKGIADGIIIFWDEFTSVMDTIKSDRINVLQNIAEKSQNNNLFLFLISHRAEAQSSDSKGKDITKMSDRFDNVEYKMDDISTYLIMRHTFGVKEGVEDYQIRVMQYNRTHNLTGLLDYLCPSKKEEEQKYISDLFPMHPYTAYLCSILSNLIGSANRSVIRFMNDETDGFKAFLDNETYYNTDQLVTAEWLWDFFESEFDNDAQCSIFTNVFRTESVHLQGMSDDYYRVFKTILLLNALQTKFPDDRTPERIAPNDKNLEFIFLGDRLYDKLHSILDYIDSNKIVARNVWGEFKISATSYNTNEIADEKAKLQGTYKSALSILEYDGGKKNTLLAPLAVGESVIRKVEVQFYSCEDTESIIRSRLKKFVTEKPNVLHVGLFLSITEEALETMQNRVRELSLECQNAILVIPDEVFSNDARNKFIDFMANYALAKRYFNETQASECEKSAKKYIEKWVQQISAGSYRLYFNGEPYSDGIYKEIGKLLNRKISRQIFPLGMESIKKLQSAVPMTFFKNKNYPAVVDTILQAQDRDQLTTFVGENTPIKLIFQENDTFLIREDGELTEAALAGNSWLVQICKQMDKCIEEAHKKYQDRFSLSEVLAPFMMPPYGFFPSKANWAALAYALRKHKGDLFQPSTSQPVSNEGLSDMVVLLFKMWDEGRSESSNKLLLRFGSPEESKLTKQIADFFNLKDVVNINEIKSLHNARWGVQEFCKKVSMQPLWTLNYCEKVAQNEKYQRAIKNIISLFEQESPKIDRIKELSNQLDSLKLELPAILKNPENYQQGFLRFVEKIEKEDDVSIKKEWWSELLEELTILQEEVAFRKESDVENLILKFYNRKTKPAASPVSSDNTPSSQGSGYSSVSATTSTPQETPVATKPVVSEDVITAAKNNVKGMNMPNMMWQQMILELINEHPEVAEYITKYLS